MLRCEKCGFESSSIDEVTGYNAFGEPYTELDYEGYGCDVEECKAVLCNECVECYEFEERVPVEDMGKALKEACLKNTKNIRI